MAGVQRGPNGGFVLGPTSKPLRAGSPNVPVQAMWIDPSNITLLSSVTAGAQLATLSFIGFPEATSVSFSNEFSNEFADESYTATLADDAGGRVALVGDWKTGYRLIAGVTAMGAASVREVRIAVSGFVETFPISLTILADGGVVDPDQPASALYTGKVENYDAVTSLVDQEMQAGLPFRKGDVMPGNIVRAVVDGVQIPIQLSNRIYWTDGSLKHAQARWLMPAIAAGGNKSITWMREPGTWVAQDTALHDKPTAVTSKVTAEWIFRSWKGRTDANVLTSEKGEKRFSSTTMLADANGPYIDAIMAGPVCSEWRCTDMATLADAQKDANLGAFLYARAWGGTAGNPRRIQFLFKSIYGWNTDVNADEQGVQVSIDLVVNQTVVRGATLGTTGWSAVNSFKGGFMASVGPTGKMDWFDVATSSFFTPPKLQYRHDVTYGIASKLFPPYDVDNPAFPMTNTPPSYAPMKIGLLRPIQADVADAAMITWGTSQPHAWSIAAHARATGDQVANFEQAMRNTAWGMGAMHGQGYNRTTRKVLCYLPPARNPDPTAIGPSIWNGTRPASPSSNLNTAITELDAAHFPQINLWTYMSEGDQHFLDALYMETTLPGLYEAPAYGFYGTMDYQSTPFGGISMYGQIRAVGHGVRPGLAAYGMGNPADPNWKLAKAYVLHWIEMSRLQPYNSTAWRAVGGNGNDRTDGRRFQDLKLKEIGSTSAGFKPWMHYFGSAALAYGYGLTEDADVKEQAEWWAHIPTVLAGGYHNDTGAQYYHMKGDPFAAVQYFVLVNNQGSGATNEDLRPWLHGQWHHFVEQTTFKADNQTLSFISTTSPPVAGQIITITGIFNGNDPPSVSDATKVPAGVTRGIPYYVVQPSGQNFKISLSIGGQPITFNAGGADIVGRCIRRAVAGEPGHSFTAASNFPTAANSYFVHAIATLDFIQWYVMPNDARVKLARNNLLSRKDANAGNGFDVRGKTIVPR